MPKRIQRRRTSGYKLPAGCLYVGRPTIWGNPFLFVQKEYSDELALKLYAELARGGWDPSIVEGLLDEEVAKIYEAHHQWLKRIQIHPVERAISDLRGHDLACWCPLVGKDGAKVLCHADVLLEIANR